MRNNIEVCKCGKHCYPSEAAANRAKIKYSDIKRIYPCYELGKEVWHTTAENYKETYHSREMHRTFPETTKIKNRYNQLLKKLKNAETKK